MASKLDILERTSFLSSTTKQVQQAGDFDAMKTPDIEGGALREGGAPKLFSKDCIGLLAQYAAVGLIYGTLPGTAYPFLLNYLNMEGTQVVSARVLMLIPWSFKVVYGIISDCFPICGYRRRPYMLLGWSLALIMLIIMASSKVGDPYWPDRKMIKMKPESYPPELAAKINTEAPHQGGKYVIYMMLAAVGYVMADVAADGVVCELAQREPEAVRGRTQTAIYLTRHIFLIISAIISAMLFNGKPYGGKFEYTLTFPQLMLLLACCLAPVLPVTWFFIKEERSPGVSVKEYMKEFWELLQTRAMYQIIAYKFLSGVFDNFVYVAADPVQGIWVQATNFSDKLATIFGRLVFAATLFVTGKYGLHWNWRVMAVVTLLSIIAIDMLVTLLTTWDVVRSPWFWLGVPVVEELPSGVQFIIGTYVVVELAGMGNEGAVYGLITTVSNLSSPVASTIAKNVNAGFAVTNADIKSDTNAVRWDVTYTILIMNAAKLFSLVFLPLLPRQKAETQELRRTGGSNKYMGMLTVFYVTFALCYSVMVNIMSIFPSTECLRIAGGRGCDKKGD